MTANETLKPCNPGTRRRGGTRGEPRARDALRMAESRLGADAEGELARIMEAAQRALPVFTIESDMADPSAPLSSKRVADWAELGETGLRAGAAILPVGDLAVLARDGERHRHVLVHAHKTGPRSRLLLIAQLSALETGAEWRPVTRVLARDSGHPGIEPHVGDPPDGRGPLSPDPADPRVAIAVRAVYALAGLQTRKPRAVHRTTDDAPALDAERREVTFVPHAEREAVVGPLAVGGHPLSPPTSAETATTGVMLRHGCVARGGPDGTVPRKACLVRAAGSGDRPVFARVTPACCVVG